MRVYKINLIISKLIIIKFSIASGMIISIIQARMGSKRLPGKTLMNIDGKKSVLEVVVNQISESKLVDKIVVATSKSKKDDIIENFCSENHITFFRGNQHNVLDRYFQCAKKFNPDVIVRITADCPLIEPQIIDKVIKKFLKNNFDYISNNKPRTFPYGMDLEVFSFNTLTKCFQEAKLPSELEHVTPYIYNNPKKFKIGFLKNKNNFSKIRITVDRENDIKLIRKIMKKIKNRPILLVDLLNLYNKEPKIFQINQSYVTDEGYLDSIKKDNLKK